MKHRKIVFLLLAVPAILAVGFWGDLRLRNRPAVDQAWATVAAHGSTVILSRDVTQNQEAEYTQGVLYDVGSQTALPLGEPQDTTQPSRPPGVLNSSGSKVLYQTQDGLTEWNLSSGTRQLVLPTEEIGSRGRWRYLPNSTDFCCVCVADSGDGYFLQVYHRASETWEDICPVPGGFDFGWLDQTWAVVLDETGLAIYDRSTGTMRHWLTLDLVKNGSSWGCPSFALSEDGEKLAYCTRDEVLHLLDMAHEKDIIVDASALDSYPAMGHSLRFSFSPDGQALLFCVRKWKNTLFNPEYDTLCVWSGGTVQTLSQSDAYELFQFDW